MRREHFRLASRPPAFLASARLWIRARSLRTSNHPTGAPRRLSRPSGRLLQPIRQLRLDERRQPIPLATASRRCVWRCSIWLATAAVVREYSSIIHFDTPTSGDVLPTRLSCRGLSKLDAGLIVPPDGAGISLLKPSLDRAVALAASQPDITPVLTVLSDFELFDQTVGARCSDRLSGPGTCGRVSVSTATSGIGRSRRSGDPHSADRCAGRGCPGHLRVDDDLETHAAPPSAGPHQQGRCVMGRLTTIMCTTSPAR